MTSLILMSIGRQTLDIVWLDFFAFSDDYRSIPGQHTLKCLGSTTRSSEKAGCLEPTFLKCFTDSAYLPLILAR